MSILKVANVHFEATGTNRIDYLGDDKIRINTANGTILDGATNDALLRITQTGTGDALRIEDSANPDASPFVVDATGNVGIGSAQAGGKFNVYDATSAVILLQGDNQTQTLIERASEDTLAAFNVLRKSRGSTASKSNVATGDIIGNLSYQAWGGSNWRAMGTILTGVENYVSDTNMSGYIALSTNDQTTGVSERMRIAASGNVLIGRTDSTVGLGVKLDVNGSINCSNIFVNGNVVSGGGTTIFTANLGNGSANTFNVAHNLNNLFVIPAVREYSSGYYVYPDIKTTTPDHIVIEFVNAPSTNQYAVLVVG